MVDSNGENAITTAAKNGQVKTIEAIMEINPVFLKSKNCWNLDALDYALAMKISGKGELYSIMEKDPDLKKEFESLKWIYILGGLNVIAFFSVLPLAVGYRVTCLRKDIIKWRKLQLIFKILNGTLSKQEQEDLLGRKLKQQKDLVKKALIKMGDKRRSQLPSTGDHFVDKNKLLLSAISIAIENEFTSMENYFSLGTVSKELYLMTRGLPSLKGLIIHFGQDT